MDLPAQQRPSPICVTTLDMNKSGIVMPSSYNQLIRPFQVLLLKTSHDLLDFHYLPLEVNRYSIASAPAAQHPSICVQVMHL